MNNTRGFRYWFGAPKGEKSLSKLVECRMYGLPVLKHKKEFLEFQRHKKYFTCKKMNSWPSIH